MARYSTDKWESIKEKLATARAEQAPEDSPSVSDEEHQKRLERVREWEAERRSVAARKAAITRKENARAAKQVMAEIEAEDRAEGKVPPTPEESERKAKEFLSGVDSRHRKPASHNYGTYRMKLPENTFRAYKRLRIGNESLFHFVVRLIDAELTRTLQRELQKAYEELG